MNLQEAALARGRYRIIMMSCGYVESNMTSWLIYSTFTREDRFDTAAQAVMELALDLHAKYEDEVLSTQYVFHKDCCKKAKADSNTKFCPKCGTRLQVTEFNADHFMEYIRGLHNTDCDGYGESERTSKRSFAFWPWRAHDLVGASKDEVVFIGENAERVILDALYEIRDDLQKLEYSGNYEPDEEWRCQDWLDVRKHGTNHSF